LSQVKVGGIFLPLERLNMENGKSLWPSLVVILFGAIGFLVVYKYITHEIEITSSFVEEEEGELAYTR
jgi:dolichol kinase